MKRRFSSPSPSLAIACAVAATGLGLLSLTLVGAPWRFVAINGGALVIGLALVALVKGWRAHLPRGSGAIALLTGLVLLATALFGVRVEDAARWIGLSRVPIQPAFVLLPAAVVAFARSPSPLAGGGIALAAGALALQPDRGMAAALAASLAVLALVRRDRSTLGLFAVCITGLIATFMRPDSLPVQPFVEHVLRTALADSLAGVAAWVGVMLLLLPAIDGWRREPQDRAPVAAFGVFWLAALIASTVAAYPTPVVGYGASAVLGYVLSLLPLGRGWRAKGIDRDAAAALSRSP